MYAKAPPPGGLLISTPTFEDIHEYSTVLDSLCSSFGNVTNVTIKGNTITAKEAMVTKDFFKVFNVYPSLGTVFQKDGQEGVILLHHFWKRVFDSNPNVVGEKLTIDEIDKPIIGVMPEGFRRIYPHGSKDFLTSLDLHSNRVMGLTVWNRRNVHNSSHRQNG